MSWKMFLDSRMIDASSRLLIRKGGEHSFGDPVEFVAGFKMETIAPMSPGPEAIRSGWGQADEARAFLQAAIDCAWENGMRPAGWADHGREVAALRDHLHDMRALVYAGDMKPEEKTPPLLPSQRPK